MQLYPAPDDEYEIHWPALYHEPPLSTSPANPISINQWTENGYTVVMSKTGIIMAQTLQNQEALQAFIANYNLAYKDLHHESVAREDTGQDEARGDDYAIRDFTA